MRNHNVLEFTQNLDVQCGVSPAGDHPALTSHFINSGVTHFMKMADGVAQKAEGLKLQFRRTHERLHRMNARTEWKKIQAVLGTTQDGVPGPHDEEALTRLRLHAKLDTERWEPEGKIVTSFPNSGPVDDRSEKVIATLLPPLHNPARELVWQAAQQGIQIRIISGTRTYAEQQALYDQGRTRPGKIVTNAKPGSSWHNHGVAFDIGVFRDGSYIEESPAYRTVGQIGKSLGFEWGGDFQSIVDEPHFQMTNGKSLAQARELHEEGKTVFS